MIDLEPKQAELIRNCFELLKKGAEEKDHPMHLVILGTSYEQMPDMRYVVWRSFNDKYFSGWIFTDIRSNKISHLHKNPVAQLLFYDDEKRIQIRVLVNITIHHNNEIAKETYNSLRGGQESYNTFEEPGTPKNHYAEAVQMRKSFDSQYFAILEAQFIKMEVLQLTEPQHTRFSYDFKTKKFSWLTP